MIDCLFCFLRFFAEASSTSFCSNPDALGIDESETGNFDSLKSIAHLPPSPLNGDDRVADSAVGMAENLVPGEAGRKSSVVDTGK